MAEIRTVRVSVIIPCYNIEQHLSKCIESILSQTYTNFELLLIDDGSTDGTLKICNKYGEKDSRIKVFTHSNSGVSYTRNRGINLATGEYIIFIDGDDYIKEDYIEKLLNGVEEGAWPICGMINVRNSHALENEHFRQLAVLYPGGVIYEEDLINLLKFSSLSSPCARLYDISIIVEHGIIFDEEITYQEDLIFNLQYIRHIQKAVVLNYYGYFYIEHPVSSTGRYHKKFDHLQLITDELRKMVRNSEDELVVKEFIFQSTMRQIANIFHVNAPQAKAEKITILRSVFLAKPFFYVQDFIYRSKVNLVLKFILKIKNPHLVYLYYKKLHQ